MTDDAATGSTVKLTVTTEKRECHAIPVDAVYIQRRGKAYVYLYEDGKAKKASIEVGSTMTLCGSHRRTFRRRSRREQPGATTCYEGADIQLAGSKRERGRPECPDREMITAQPAAVPRRRADHGTYEYVLKRTVTTILALLCILVIRYLSVFSATLEQIPDTDQPMLIVRASQPGRDAGGHG